MWDIEVTDQFAAWYASLDDADSEKVTAAVDELAQAGPSMGRPLVDTIKTSRYANMKELRPTRSIRVLFAFDPRRSAVLLLGGDKRGAWAEWYKQMVPLADALYAEHLRTLDGEGLL